MRVLVMIGDSLVEVVSVVPNDGGPTDRTHTGPHWAPASPTRQPIMLLFARGVGLSVGEVAEQVGIGQSTPRSSSRCCAAAGSSPRRDGKIVLYRSDRDGSWRPSPICRPTCRPAEPPPAAPNPRCIATI